MPVNLTARRKFNLDTSLLDVHEHLRAAIAATCYTRHPKYRARKATEPGRDTREDGVSGHQVFPKNGRMMGRFKNQTASPRVSGTLMPP